MRHSVKRALCLLVLLTMLLTLSSVFTLSTVASPISSTPMIAVGDKFMIVQTSSGKLWGWGSNAAGILGQTGGNITTPVEIQLASGVLSVSVSAGADHVLALGSDGNVYAWGNNEYGQLGMAGTTASLSIPTVVAELQGKHIVSVSAGNRFSLALSEDGSVYSFGRNHKRQLGYETAEEISATPTLIAALNDVNVKQITAGIESAVAINEVGKLYTWGNTANGLLGVAGNAINQEPLPLDDSKASTPIVATALSAYHSVHLLNTGKVGFMGHNLYGQFGNNKVETNERFTTLVKTYADHPDTFFTAIAASNQQTVLLGADGTVYTAGMRIPDDTDSASNTFVPLFADASTASKAIAIGAGYANAAMIAQDGSIWTWGDNSCGQLANGGTGIGSDIPLKVTLDDEVVSNEGNTTPSNPVTPRPGQDGVVSVPIRFTASVPAPTYSIVIPANVDIGELQQTDEDDPNRYSLTKFTIEARNVDNLFGENEIRLSVDAQNEENIFRLQNESGAAIPFDLIPNPDAQTSLTGGSVLARFTEDGTVDTWIRIDRSKISGTGTYTGVLTFRYSVADIENEEEQQ